MNKESAPEELIGAVRKVLEGSVYVSPLLAERLALDLRANPERLLHELLSEAGIRGSADARLRKTVTEIAAELHLSLPTVSTHRAHILAKMNMTSTAALISYAVHNRLVD